MTIVALFIPALIFALNLCANIWGFQLTRETQVKDGRLETMDGEPVATRTFKSACYLFQVLEMTNEELVGMDYISFVLTGTGAGAAVVEMTMDYSAVGRSGDTVSLYGDGGVLTVNAANVTYAHPIACPTGCAVRTCDDVEAGRRLSHMTDQTTGEMFYSATLYEKVKWKTYFEMHGYTHCQSKRLENQDYNSEICKTIRDCVSKDDSWGLHIDTDNPAHPTASCQSGGPVTVYAVTGELKTYPGYLQLIYEPPSHDQYTFHCNGDMTACESNYFVRNHECEPCPLGTTNLAGDLKAGPDTSCYDERCQPGQYYEDEHNICHDTLCARDYHVSNHNCIPCESRLLSDHGHHIASGMDTACYNQCSENYHVSGHKCVACPSTITVTMHRAQGDKTTGIDTHCHA